MAQEPVLANDRAEFLRNEWNRSIALQLRILDWRSGLAWAAFAGLMVLCVLSTTESPLGWVALVVVIAASVAYGVASRRRVLRLVGELLAMADEEPAGSATIDSASWDRSRLGTIPEYYLQPADADSARQLDGMLRLSPDALKAQMAETRSAMVSVLFFGVLSLGGIALAGIALIVWLSSALAAPDVIDGLRGLVPIPLPVIASALAGVALAMPLAENAFLVRASRILAGHLSTAASAELPRLWLRDPGFTTGQVVIWTPNGYTLDPTRMSVSPDQPVRTKKARSIVWITVGILIGLAIGVTALTSALDSVLT